VGLKARKERAVLAYLALRAGSDVSTGELTRALWGDDEPASSVKTLQNYVSALRRALPPGTIETTPAGYRLLVDPEDVDVSKFEKLLRSAQAGFDGGDPRQALADTEAALALWRGDPLPDLSDQLPGMTEAARLAEMRWAAEEKRFDARLEMGQHAELIGDLEAAVAAEPLRERRWEQLMIALYRSGRQTEALRAFRRLGAALEEAGVVPGERARALEAAIATQDPNLRLPAPPPAPRPSSTDRGEHLPRGNVTFLITEIEDSTRLLKRLGPAFRDVVDRYREILRQTVNDFEGVEIESEGDGLFAVFGDAVQAISACLDGQQHLDSNDWGKGVSVRVRMGLVTGHARPNAAGDYTSLAVHQAGRLCAAAHGGQVLLSADTARMVRHDLPEESSFVDRGPYLLSGFDEPERIYQLLHPRLRSAFPPLHASPAQSHNLPDLRMAFIGRESDLDAVQRLLGEGRLITVVGAGGAGKTRLAVEMAARMAARYTGGVHLCDLSPQTNPDLVASAIGEAFGIRDVSDPLSAVVQLIEDRPALLVLDSCEHLLDGVAVAVDTLLASSSGLRILATSREPLGVEGEHLWRLGALTLPDEDDLAAIRASEAVQLFESRARLVQPTFVVDEDKAGAVADICRQLEGLPLAIELVAAQAGALSPEAIAERLADSAQMLKAGSERRADRHRDLEATVDWSYRLLDEEARRLLRSLSVFANGFTLDAVRAVSDFDDAVGVLTRLVDKSLIVWDSDASRYRMLESIRAFARARLDSAGETDAAAARHLAWCASVAESFRTRSGASEHDRYDVFGREMDNFRVALVWAASHRSPDAARLAGAVGAESGTPPDAPDPAVVWELVARPDRSYFERVLVEDVEFPVAAPVRRFVLTGERATIGRSAQGVVPDVDLSTRPTDTGISRHHAALVRHNGRWAIVDEGSTNGTYLNDGAEPLPPQQPVVLSEGDEVHIGAWTTLTLHRRSSD
jgi:predicted ATPase/class 3 adenylate cyclase